MEIDALLQILASRHGSDLYLSTGAPPSAKFDGVLKALTDQPFKPGEVAAIAASIMDAEQRLEFDRDLEMNLALSLPGVGRFRLNIFKQRNDVSIVARNIKLDIPRFEDLNLPPVLLETVMLKQGLMLFVGSTGSGKSTSLAALIDYRNRHSSGHIITIEDPVEFIHRHKKSIVNQREVGVDTRSFHAALKNTLRQAPDVVLIGEIRDRETMEHALAFADTGHLVISTLHAHNANQALDRVINFFPEERRGQLLNDLGNNLKAFVSQRLVRTRDGQRRAAVEVMLGTPTIGDLIRRNEFGELKGIMEKSSEVGMQTFDGALFALFAEGAIDEAEALKHADSVNNLRLRLKMHAEATPGPHTPPGEWGLMD
ncbi:MULTISPECIES: PilT/PilU family type 4a pilus ATPase [Pseudomonas]|uniref:PilT/PilU family type 4a pilus ATPase n=1 Tax=Pseudomonas TaxID=286 RepID=UPI000B350EFB|nr:MULTISPECIES: PilT/PilU family type 4a pilus ATPase [Pseudomonas]PMY53126.1 type IV pili twitching motility protein PilT [Pseudomonas sp. FW305-53]PMY86544.1 type IV pili twitching motility protein PilT [Pseudomonas sp. FW303-C2]PMY90511.1 type IV pili twitching motility protein PilT [Pseudomonas sp. FW305-62]PNA42737.1 type IV pili twitching motility protein PilT [Pseudomonas sp. FW306-2-2C-A10BC]PNA85620.1 type IV pili twitching motility protein PilT [Pseudomonas sp. MPR-R3B]